MAIHCSNRVIGDNVAHKAAIVPERAINGDDLTQELDIICAQRSADDGPLVNLRSS